MRKLYVLLFSIVGALVMGLLWTVGQTGRPDTNAHLCEFARHYFPDVPTDCQAADWIVSAAGWLFVVAVLVAIADIAWIAASWKGWSRKAPEIAMTPAPSLEIHFDPTNFARRFWSFESPRDADGKTLPGLFHEYRVAIHNPTMRTARNVSVTVENLGMIGQRPVAPLFDNGRITHKDINPGCFELVPVANWPHPKVQAGFPTNLSALVTFGPIIVTVHGDDMAPVRRQFWFDYQREPMLFDSLEPGEEERARASLTLL